MSEKQNCLILLGAPGAGKGTQALKMAEYYKIPHISTGEILREAVAKGTEFGKQVKAVIDSGQLVSDAVMITLVKERLQLSDCDKGFLLDGFPRTIDQAKSLDALCAELNKPAPRIIMFDVPEDELLNRLKSRGASSGRADDDEAVIMTRLAVYEQKTAPLVSFYDAASRLIKVDGSAEVEQVFESVKNSLK